MIILLLVTNVELGPGGGVTVGLVVRVKEGNLPGQSICVGKLYERKSSVYLTVLYIVVVVFVFSARHHNPFRHHHHPDAPRGRVYYVILPCHRGGRGMHIGEPVIICRSYSRPCLHRCIHLELYSYALRLVLILHPHLHHNHHILLLLPD